MELDGVDSDVLAPTTYEYEEGRLTKVRQEPGRLIRLTYDEGGALHEVIDDKMNRTLVSYTNDELQFPVRIEMPDDSAIVLGHDANGNLTSVTPPGRAAHTMTYSSLDQLVSYQPPVDGGQSANAFLQYFGHNEDHQPTGIAVGGQAAVILDYDMFGRLSSMQTLGRNIDVDYEATTGELSAVSVPGQTITYGRDGFLPVSDIWAGTAEGSIGRIFNSRFQLAEETTTAGGSTDVVGYGYDADGLLTTVDGITLVRDPKIGRVAEVRIGKLVESFKYNPYGELASHKVSHTSVGNLLSFSYERDSLGRITEVRETVLQEEEPVSTGYTYQIHRGWLAQVTKPGETKTYSFDVNGNRQDSGVVHDAQDRLTQWNGETFEYDDFGSLERRTSLDAERTFTYDVWGNLHEVQTTDSDTGSQTTITYGTDGHNRRISKSVDGALRWKALYRSSLQPAAWIKMNDDGTQEVTHFVYATGRNSPDLMIRDSRVYWLIVDHVGSVRRVVDVSTGAELQQIDYDAWGQITNEVGAGFQPFAFGGGILDRDTGLVRFGARDYDPRLGRWTTKDPLRFDGGSTNLYQYANGDPVNFVDPGGRIAWAAWFMFGMVAASPFVENCDDFGGYVDMVDAGLWATALGPLAGRAAQGAVARLAARGGGEAFGAATGKAWPVALHDTTTPWWKPLRPRYTGAYTYTTRGRTAAQIARTIAHEQTHVADFARFPGITHLATKGRYFPGRGFARYFLERRAYVHGGDYALSAPFRSMRMVGGSMENFYADLGLVVGIGGVGTGVALY